MPSQTLEDRMDGANRRARDCGLVPPPETLAELFCRVTADGADPRSRAWETVSDKERGNPMDKAMQELCLLNKPKSSISVQVTDYVPDFVADLLRGLSPLARWLLVHEAAVDTSIRTLRTMADEALVADESHIGTLSRGADVLGVTVATARDEVARAIGAILQSDRGDVLGSYHFGTDRKYILIHWIPIWLFARRLGVDYAALLHVTLAHEYAHYYTHLGRDSNAGGDQRGNQRNHRADVDEFSLREFESVDDLDIRELDRAFHRMDLEVKEGLAQFYTFLLCNKWIRASEPWSNSPLVAFNALLGRQSRPYLWWSEWRQPPEVVRSAILRARSADEQVSGQTWIDYLQLEATHRRPARASRT